MMTTPTGFERISTMLESSCTITTRRSVAVNIGSTSAVSGRNASAQSDFDPDKSNRETRKLVRKIYTEPKRKQQVLYDGNGIHLATGQDLCDCLIRNCPGCHFPCQRCRSLKCGHECRQHRRWQYDPGLKERMKCSNNSKDSKDDEIEAID